MKCVKIIYTVLTYNKVRNEHIGIARERGSRFIIWFVCQSICLQNYQLYRCYF